MQSRYNVINLKDFYLPNREFSISESDLTDFLASFSSPLNQDIEQFLHRTAVESSKKGQSSTYIVIDNEYEHLAGYFTLSLRAIRVPVTKIIYLISTPKILLFLSIPENPKVCHLIACISYSDLYEQTLSQDYLALFVLLPL